MSHPILWPKPLFFYAIGNTPAIDLTRGLSYDEHAHMLLLGCGDPRSIMYSLYAGIAPSRENFSMDATCCDIQPGILARNALILTLFADGHSAHEIWNITYHPKIDVASLSTIRTQCKKLAEYAESPTIWRECPHSNWLRVSSVHTLQELRRYWSSYQDELSPSQESSLDKERRGRTIAGTPSPWNLCRGAGQYMLQASSPMLDHFEHYRRTGVVDLDASSTPTHLNPTFFYSLLGLGVDFHYQSYPLAGFHLAEQFATPNGYSDFAKVVDCAKGQFKIWGEAFRAAVRGERGARVVVRMHVGDALTFCDALVNQASERPSSLQPPLAAWSSSCVILDGDDYTGTTSHPAPLTFNVIDTSNLVDNVQMLNLLIAGAPLLASSTTATLYTETFFASETGPEALSKSLLMDPDIAATLLGITPAPYVLGFTSESNVSDLMAAAAAAASYNDPRAKLHHEVIPWKHTSLTPLASSPSFAPKDLAMLVFNVYQKMMSHEDMQEVMQQRRSGRLLNVMLHYHRGTVIALLRLIKRRRLTGDWTACMEVSGRKGVECRGVCGCV